MYPSIKKILRFRSANEAAADRREDWGELQFISHARNDTYVYVTSLDSSMYVYPIYVSMPVSCLGRAPTTTKKDGQAKESVVAEIPTNYETCERELWLLGLGGCVST